jgi:hypothetical protein
MSCNCIGKEGGIQMLASLAPSTQTIGLGSLFRTTRMTLPTGKMSKSEVNEYILIENALNCF